MNLHGKTLLIPDDLIHTKKDRSFLEKLNQEKVEFLLLSQKNSMLIGKISSLFYGKISFTPPLKRLYNISVPVKKQQRFLIWDQIKSNKKS